MKQQINKRKLDLLKLSNEIKDKTLKFVSISANQSFNFDTNFHRILLTEALRSRKDPEGLRDRVLNWDFSIKENVSPRFSKGWVKRQCVKY